MVNLLHLRTLLEVTRLGSFAAAATRLGYTSSAVSQQMAALERDTGVELFHRSARSVVPTEAAFTMVRHATKVLTDVETLLAAASRSTDSPVQELRVGIFPSLATYVLPDILRNPRWKKLGIELRVSVAEPVQTIQGLRTGGDLDLALVYQVGQSGLAWPHTLERQWIGDDDFKVVLPASWGIREDAEMQASQLSDMPWIIHHPGTSDAVVIERLFASCNLHPHVVAYSDDFHASLEMAAAGLGAALVPELALRNRPPGVVLLDVPDIRLARNVFALLINEKRTAHVQLFTELLADTLRGSASAVRAGVAATTPKTRQKSTTKPLT
ncbi:MULTISPECIES: LysR family transcriptional regulator [Arthrobacter]|uniref:LysR family transcriptional regulator n=1 Tax=Arthrobacter terricola TaxID=2547396 RepID=A0A4R5KVZ9_9MICC|nr:MULTISPECIES: LysR family transcriptional regulator [Arthrobacter]MBT8160352.1 LysR family transcriptional regulator [Arthrobacter sp. GN70]TDF99956.1 LysR family transcriptional regulator [Arthrobacter terricola]